MAKSFFFLDAGRKFFSKAVIEKLIDSVSDAGIDYFNLYFSDNQGFRFSLDDMIVKTEYGEYDLSIALGDGYCQPEENKAPCGTNGYLTQADMDGIIDYANSKGVELFPAFEIPGHMGALLEKFSHLRYEGSKSSLDITNPEAVAFAYAVLEKYATYFKSRGCKLFNIGGDEFANDLGTMGFERIYNDGKMKSFVTFINGAAQILFDMGFEVCAFNDGFCYNNDAETYGKLDTRITVLVWSPGWGGYRLAKPSYLKEQGYHLVNAAEKYYIACDCEDWEEKKNIISNFELHSFGVKEPEYIEKVSGGMICVWTDHGHTYGPDNGVALLEYLPPLISTFGEAFKKYK